MAEQRLRELDAEIEHVRSAVVLDDIKNFEGIYPGQLVQGGAGNRHPPICRLPPEILGEIFYMSTLWWRGEYYPLRDPIDTVDRRHPPWVLIQVCRKWRYVALSFPSLWSSIIVKLHFVRSELHIKTLLLSVEILLRRSANAPLFIRISGMYGDISFGKLWMEMILDGLLRHSERWLEVDFETSLTYIQRLAAVKGHIPLLHRVRLGVSETSKEFWDQMNGDLDAFAQCPSLRYLELDGTPSTKEFNIPWPQLTYYKGIDSQQEKQIILLRGMTSLTHANIQILDNYSEPLPPTPPVLLLNVHTFELSGDSHFLDNLILPSLQTLNIEMMQDAGPLLPLIHRSSCTLTSIHLEAWGRDMEDTDFVEIFKLTPGVTFINLVDRSGVMITENYNPDDPYSCLLPNISTLKVLFHLEANESHAGSFLKMVESRWRVNSSAFITRLRSVHVQARHVGRPRIYWELQPRLELLKKEGLETVVGPYQYYR